MSFSSQKFDLKRLFLQSLIFILALCPQVGFAKDAEITWDWSKINTSAVYFKPNFVFGTAGAGHQYLGAVNCPASNWADWDYAKDKKGKPRINNGQKSGIACDFWNNLDADIALMKEMKLKAFRFSIDWNLIEPVQGYINKDAIKKYHTLCDKLIENGIEPVMTLHHFTHPTWFESNGGFEKEENIQLFVDYCVLMVNELKSKVKMWAIFNEPGVYTFQSYLRGVWPPGKKSIKLGMHVLKNMLKAHVVTYEAIKKIPECQSLQIGIAHSITQFDPCNNNYLERKTCDTINLLFYDAITEFFSSGNFNVVIPGIVNIKWACPQASQTIDFFGINYYSHKVLQINPLKLKFGDIYRPGEVKTDMPYGEYAPGLYRAIKDVSERITAARKIPIYITESGIADHKDDRRKQYIERYIYALHKAIEDGFDVRGYFYWSMLDNFEWTEGYEQKFGLYHVDMKTQKRTLREGAKAFAHVVAQTYSDSNKHDYEIKRNMMIAMKYLPQQVRAKYLEKNLLKIETDRLIMREFIPEDIDELAQIYANEEVMKFSLAGKAMNKEQAQEKLCEYMNHYKDAGIGKWALIDKASGKLVGYCGLSKTPEMFGEQFVEIGYRLDRNFWGQGLAQEAAKAVCEYGFKKLGLKKIVAVVDPKNSASQHILEKLGMSYWQQGSYHGITMNVYTINAS